MRVCDKGVKQTKQGRHASCSRGRIKVGQEYDERRWRTVLTACFMPSRGEKELLPLHDVVLIASTGDYWTLAGFEHYPAGPLGKEHSFGQTWILELAAQRDLIDAERKWGAAAVEANELREQLRVLGGGS